MEYTYLLVCKKQRHHTVIKASLFLLVKKALKDSHFKAAKDVLTIITSIFPIQ